MRCEEYQLRKAIHLLKGSLVLISFFAALWAQTVASESEPKPTKSFDVPFKEFKLKNGLRVIISEDHSAPTYSICMTYNVGSRDERPGRTGFAHLFEHMMFQGSENVGKGEHFILVLNNGGTANGMTNADRTAYFQTLPANELELGIFLEADRMRSLRINQANFDNQRQTVMEERRQNYDNRPYGKTAETVLATAYDNFAYKHSTIGSMEDLNAATLEDVRDFFRMYYAPNNAVLSLVGAFKTENAFALVKKYFESIPSHSPPPAPDMTEPEQKGERRQTLEDAFAQTPRIDIVYKVPPGDTSEAYALKVWGHVLGGGLSSRLYQKLVKEKEMALSISAGPDERRYTSLFWISIMVRPRVSLTEVEALVFEELERAKTELIADWELDKIRMQLRRQHAQGLYSTRSRATMLGRYAVYYDKPELINTVWQKISQVSKADLQRVAIAYLTETNRTVVTTMPKAQVATPTNRRVP